MTQNQKIEAAIKSAYSRGKISKEILASLPSPTDLAKGIVVVGGVLIAVGAAGTLVASTGVGAIAETAAAAISAAIVLGLSAMGIIASLSQIKAGITMLVEFHHATRVAKTPEDIDKAGDRFANGIADSGAGVVMGILSVVGARQGLQMAKAAKLSAASNPKTLGQTQEQSPPTPSEPEATGFRGSGGFELRNARYQKTRNSATDINGRTYSGHALDQMQNRGVLPSVVENAIATVEAIPGKKPGTLQINDTTNKIVVILNSETKAVVTVIRGVGK